MTSSIGGFLSFDNIFLKLYASEFVSYVDTIRYNIIIIIEVLKKKTRTLSSNKKLTNKKPFYTLLTALPQITCPHYRT